jgi:hypothetical protein
MSVKRLILDTGKLDQDRIIGSGTVVLDTRASLDTNIISGTGYDASLGYDSNVNLYDGSSLVYDYAASDFGGLTATLQSTPQVNVSASANLGNVSSSAQAKVDHFVSASSTLNSLVAQSIAIINHFNQAQASLNGLQSSATSSVKQLPIAQANLQSLNSAAEATVTPVTPPAPSPGGGVPNYRRKKPQFIDLVQEPLIVQKPVVEVLGHSSIILGSFSAKAQSNIEWSILEDDAEILLLL